jgi:PAS domain S-box-containing protein
LNKTDTQQIRKGILILASILLVGGLLINAYVDRERQRDLDDWAIRLGLVAETRVEAIENWLDEQRSALGELANNASVQLYLWQLSQRTQKDNATEPAQLTYLRNLIIASAERYGLTPDTSQPAIPANLPQRHDTGLAMFDDNRRLVAATKGMPEIGKAFQRTIDRALQTGETSYSELITDSHDRALFGVAVPVPLVIGAETGQDHNGVVLGVYNAARTLYPLLRRGVPVAPSDESLLVAKQDAPVVYLSPTAPGGIPTRKTLPLDRSGLAAAAAVMHPGQFGEYINYRGEAVLATSRPLRSLPWVLVQEVAAAQALQESNRHRRSLIITFSLLLFFIAAILVAAWRHGSSVRALQDADELRAKTHELQNQTELLHAVTDNTEAHILLLDEQQHVLFANSLIASTTGAKPQELVGNTLTGVLGPANAAPLIRMTEQLKQDRQTQHCTLEMALGEETRTFQCSLVPVDRVGKCDNAILLVLHDITELQQAQQKHAELLRRLVATLMHVVDLHDPYSADHTARMVEVANAVGAELKLDEQQRQSLDLATSLANLGKIFVPREVLTKLSPLTEAEQALLQRHVQFGVELLEDLDFDGPVLDTIRQKQEHLDGSGYPNHLSGDEIILTARILAVANAFVALVSPRAYRQAVSIEQALDQLLKEAGSKYDRHVVAALFHVAENRSDWSEWVDNTE